MGIIIIIIVPSLALALAAKQQMPFHTTDRRRPSQNGNRATGAGTICDLSSFCCLNFFLSLLIARRVACFGINRWLLSLARWRLLLHPLHGPHLGKILVGHPLTTFTNLRHKYFFSLSVLLPNPADWRSTPSPQSKTARMAIT